MLLTQFNADQQDMIKGLARMDIANFDSVNTPFISRLLLSLDPTLFAVKRVQTSFAKLMTVDTSTVNEGAEFYTYHVSDRTGKVQVVNGTVPHNDTPYVNANLKEIKVPVETIENGFYYTLYELQKASLQALAGSPFQIDQERRRSSLEAQERRWNQVALFGSTEANTKGLLNNTDVTANAVANDGTGTSTLWANKTGQLIVRDITERINKVRELSKGIHNPNTLALTSKAYGQLQATPFAATESKSALQYFREAHPEITNIVLAEELAGAFSTADGFIVYENNKENLAFYVAKGYTETQPINRGTSFDVKAYSRYVASTVIRYPKAIAIGTGI